MMSNKEQNVFKNQQNQMFFKVNHTLGFPSVILVFLRKFKKELHFSENKKTTIIIYKKSIEAVINYF